MPDDSLHLISQSAYFDANWYRATYPDVAFSGMSEAEHYLRIGPRLGRDPGPDFDTKAYLTRYLDVASRKDNPLVHFERHGRSEHRHPRPVPAAAARADARRVDVVVPVYNALDDVKRCLQSLSCCETGFELRILVVNDGSDVETTGWLRSACQELATKAVRFDLIEHSENRGYTTAVNTGLRASDAAYIVTLNSDTIVTPFWPDGLIRCLSSDPQLGIVGPMSNAAGWQTVPELFGPDGGKSGFLVNDLTPDMTAADMARVVKYASVRAYPRTTFVNGFCFMVRRAVLDAVGYMDEGTFPAGYGEENDFCIRAQDAGFTLAYADDTYVFHAKSKSFGHARREALSQAGSTSVRAKHGNDKFNKLLEGVMQTGPMDRVRDRVREALAVPRVSAGAVDWVTGQKVLFLLPVAGGGGGAHSVVQEASAMRAMGLDAKIAVRDADYHNFTRLYADVAGVDDVFTGFRDETVVAAAQSYDVVVATIYSSVPLLERIVRVCPWILPVYYAQDYEPMFFDQGSAEWKAADRSYGAIPGAVVMAKTHWICRQIESRNQVPTHKIEPSIDHEVYHSVKRSDPAGPICIAAMIRPSTPRRGAERTLDLLARLKARFGEKLQVRIFGCRSEDGSFKKLKRDFDFENLGILTRPQVADLLRNTDAFIDLSDYQAFGRTGLEAMACGAMAVVPQAGGADEYAVDNVNALVIDSFDVEACLKRLSTIIEQPKEMARLRLAGLATAARYSPRRAALSELLTFAPALAERRTINPLPVRPKLVLMPALTTDGAVKITGSGYVRLIAPYRQDGLAQSWDTSVLHDGSLPEPGSADVVILQRDLFPPSQAQFDTWQKAWHNSGGKLIYEIDDDLTDGAGLTERGYGGSTKALAERVKTYVRSADAVSVSTTRLAEVLSTYVPEAASKIRVIPNYLDSQLWGLQGAAPEPHTTRERPLKLGYAGTPTHTEDLMLIRDVVQELEQDHGIEFEVIGAFQRTEAPFGRRIELPNNSVYPVFTEWLTTIVDWDIAVIPLADNPFNRAKSNLKFLDYAALNTAIVCSDNVEYRKVARDGENCLMVANDANSWKEALLRLIEDPQLRHRLAAAANQDLREKWTVQKNLASYKALLDDALRKAGSRDEN